MGTIKAHEFMSLDGVVDAPTWTFDYGFDLAMARTSAISCSAAKPSCGTQHPAPRLLARRPSHTAHCLADLSVAAGAWVTAGRRGDLPNAGGSLTYPEYTQTLSVTMGRTMGMGLALENEPQHGGMAERTNATVLKTVG